MASAHVGPVGSKLRLRLQGRVMSINTQIYGSYGHPTARAAQGRAAYVGELVEIDTGWYAIGGRFYAPALRCFLGPDPASPFEEGGHSRYAYCGGDPITRIDRTGRAGMPWLVRPMPPMPRRGGSAPIRRAAGTVSFAASASAPPQNAVSSASAPDAEKLPLRTTNAATGSGRATSYLRPSLTDDKPGALTPDSPILITNDIGGRELFQESNANSFAIMAEWHEQKLPLADGSIATHWLADSAINYDHVVYPLRKIFHRKDLSSSEPIYVYAGVHGSPRGENWAAGVRQYPFPLGPADAREMLEHAAGAGVGRRVQIENIAGFSQAKMDAAMVRPGSHVHAYCYSAVDRHVLRILNVPPVPVYEFR